MIASPYQWTLRLKNSFKLVLCVFFMTVHFTRSDIILETDSVSQVDLGDNCEQLLERYASITANFTKCVIRHARPIKVCQKCIEEYTLVLQSHENITKLYEDTGEACRAELISVDRLEVIEASFNFVVGQWKKATCEKCFIHQNNITELNPNTKHILDLHEKTEMCINSTKNNFTCENCTNDYTKLNDYYDSKGSYRAFCMDIIDMMNLTRMNWSLKLKCCTDRNKPEVVFFVSSALICITPVMFYFFIWLCSKVSLDSENRWIRSRRFQRLSTSVQ